MTGRQSVPGLKGASHIGSFAGQLACSSSPFSGQVLGVYEEQSEKLAPRPYGGLYCWDSGPRVSSQGPSSSVSLPFLNWGHGAYCTLNLYLTALVRFFYSLQGWHVGIRVGWPVLVFSG